VAENRKEDIEFAYKFGSKHIKEYEELMKRYGIEKMMGQFSDGNYGWKMENILNKDIIGRIRENEQLVKFAKKYQMTNNQFMRFRIRATSSVEGYKKEKKNLRYMVDLDTLAKEIINQDKEED
jgi:hypothetical protein